MQESNFEKQVQEKIDELKLKPSEEVWQKVAVAIAKRKTGRRSSIIIFLLLVFISTIILIVLDQASGNKFNNIFSNKSQSSEANSITKSSTDSSRKQIVDLAGSAKNDPDDSITDEINGAKSGSVTIKEGNQQNAVSGRKAVKLNSLPAPDFKESNKKNGIGFKTYNNDLSNAKKIVYKNEPKTNMRIINSKPEDVAYIGSDAMASRKAIGGEVNPVINDSITNEQVTATVSKDKFIVRNYASDSLTAMLTIDPHNDDVATNSTPAKQKSSWNLGFSFSFGVTSSENRFLGIIGSGNDEQYKSNDPLLSPSAGGPGPAGVIRSKAPSKIKAGSGIILGVFVEKNISPKTYIRFGLNYKTNNSTMAIGRRVDSNNNFSQDNFFYRSGKEKNYNNHFHFVELPVAFRVKLGKQNKLPLYLNTGVTISRLVSSNTLQFDTLSGNYYRNNSLFNKTSVGVSAGLLFGLSRHAKNPFLIGPDVNFSLSKIAGSGLYKNRHYGYIGISVQKSIGRK